MVNCSNLIIKMSPRFVLGRENVPCAAEVVNRSLKADCTDFTMILFFSTVCSSFKGFKCVIQKLEDPKNSWKFVRPKKIAEILQNQKNS